MEVTDSSSVSPTSTALKKRRREMIPAASRVFRRKRFGVMVMKRILLTGLSGTGKSTIIAELAARGYNAIDADSPEYSEWLELPHDSDELGSLVEGNRDWVWREDRIQAILATEDAGVLFLSGCAQNMRKFLPQFDHIILLSAPAAVIVARLATRTSNTYGKRPEEIARVLGQIETVEPLLRRIANYEIDTSVSLSDVVADVLRLTRV